MSPAQSVSSALAQCHLVGQTSPRSYFLKHDQSFEILNNKKSIASVYHAELVPDDSQAPQRTLATNRQAKVAQTQTKVKVSLHMPER
jgi:hypothetical protein